MNQLLHAWQPVCDAQDSVLSCPFHFFKFVTNEQDIGPC